METGTKRSWRAFAAISAEEDAIGAAARSARRPWHEAPWPGIDARSSPNCGTFQLPAYLANEARKLPRGRLSNGMSQLQQRPAHGMQCRDDGPNSATLGQKTGDIKRRKTHGSSLFSQGRSACLRLSATAGPRTTGCPDPCHVAASANLANAGKDLEPVFLMMEAR